MNAALGEVASEVSQTGNVAPASARAATAGAVREMRREARALKELVADLTLENPAAQKSIRSAFGERVAVG